MNKQGLCHGRGLGPEVCAVRACAKAEAGSNNIASLTISGELPIVSKQGGLFCLLVTGY